MTNREKIEQLKKVQDYKSEIMGLLERIIKDTSDYSIDDVYNFTINDKDIEVLYWWSGHGAYGTESVNIPLEWLDEGFDYKDAYEKTLRRAQEDEKRRAAAEEKRRKERERKEEYRNYLKLKKKFEGGGK